MNRIAMSPAASGLLRCIIARASVSRNRILLTEVLSTDAEFSVRGQIVADIAVVGRPAHGCDGSTSIMIEAA